jgi:hypothetical protein
MDFRTLKYYIYIHFCGLDIFITDTLDTLFTKEKVKISDGERMVR